ncbi:formate dehydrogenase subunit delta [Paucibacter sp. APW11]|uniref:Formate dehydrogenase subunit delta n=1 Tax=Roseateles aquae TaxID=3077235 RepID=A0ABU3PH98_9BURK|nr:formate dehydrogenase subunit delta [Paucibacter sp. APW11]MDT9001790.1 formate dehydrogenase subunit delta [Paucibacter sp. APW11]
MDIEKLVRMANQIGTFFQAMPDHAEAVDGIATHIKKFWDPRMRRELLGAIDGGDAAAAGLLPLVREALQSMSNDQAQQTRSV